MKNLFILFLGLTTAMSARASGDKSVEMQVLETLIRESASITLVDADGKSIGDDYQLPGLIARHLTGGYLSAKRAGDFLILGDVSVECKDKTPKGLVGSAHYSCDVVFVDGDFQVKEDHSLYGPQLESSTSFGVQVTIAVAPNAKPVLKSKKLKVTQAG